MTSSKQKIAPDVALKAAIGRFRTLSKAKQLRTISELLKTRARELMLAYAGVVRVGIGWRRRRDHRGHSAVCWHETPCVLFMVRRKWSKRSAERADAIPRHLLTYADNTRGNRVLVAVPTDVDSSVWVRGARAEAAIHSYPKDLEVINHGIVCTVLRRSDQSSVRYGLSCRHVLSTGFLASASLAGVSADASRIKDSRIGDVENYFGRNSGLQPLDAQVFRITDATATLPKHTRFAASEADVRVPLRHQAPSLGNAASKVKYRGLWKASLEANIDGESWMFGGELLEIDLKKRTRKGDSGSAVTSLDNSTLIGMHIGSAKSKHVNGFVSICVPAWRLMDAKNFQGLPAGVTWRLP